MKQSLKNESVHSSKTNVGKEVRERVTKAKRARQPRLLPSVRMLWLEPKVKYAFDKGNKVVILNNWSQRSCKGGGGAGRPSIRLIEARMQDHMRGFILKKLVQL